MVVGGVASRAAEAQGLGDRRSAALAAGDAADRLAAGVAAHERVRASDEAEASDDAVDVRGVAAVQARVEVKCLADGEVAEESGVLLDVREGHVGVAVERPTAVRHLALDGRALAAYATGEDVQQPVVLPLPLGPRMPSRRPLSARPLEPRRISRRFLPFPTAYRSECHASVCSREASNESEGPRRPRTRRRRAVIARGGEARTGARCGYLSDDRTRMFNGFVQRSGQKKTSCGRKLTTRRGARAHTGVTRARAHPIVSPAMDPTSGSDGTSAEYPSSREQWQRAAIASVASRSGVADARRG